MKTTKQITVIVDDIETLSSLEYEGFIIVSIHVDNLEEESMEVAVAIEIGSLEDLYALSDSTIPSEKPLLSKEELYSLSVEWISENYDINIKCSKLIYSMIKNRIHTMDCDVELLCSFYKELSNLEYKY